MDLDIIDFFWVTTVKKKIFLDFADKVTIITRHRRKIIKWKNKLRNQKKINWDLWARTAVKNISCNSSSIRFLIGWLSKPICAHISCTIIQRQSVFVFLPYQIVPFVVRPKKLERRKPTKILVSFFAPSVHESFMCRHKKHCRLSYNT